MVPKKEEFHCFLDAVEKKVDFAPYQARNIQKEKKENL